MPPMNWKTEAPTEPGYYWVWQPAEQWPCRGRVHCVLVERVEAAGPVPTHLQAWVPFREYSEYLTADTWDNARWSGPIAAPVAPE
jgi:hypothetical protein